MDLARRKHSPPPEKPTPAGKKRAGRKVVKETRHPIYRGVRWKNGGKWVCEVREPNKKSRIWLGTFPSPETAAVAHDVASLALRGPHAPLNFPAAAAGLPRPRSASHQDIQRAASEAARDFNPIWTSPSARVENKVVLLIKSPDDNSLGEKDDSVDCGQTESPEDCWSGGQSATSDGADGFVDEEAVFNMPALLDSMAEGMLLTPLAMKKGFNWSEYDEVDDQGMELSLWVD
ncbi:basic helix-loop-helix protein [Salvia divinorum]|uniref:Basic helix-loop-helix protein n=1 Tax=Salvia divinorum TaxID=28513 RepID=A0ABD1HMW8_SALDI